MPNIRFIAPTPPANGGKGANPVSIAGRVYSAAPGAIVDVPDFDAIQLEANGWTRVCHVGTTAQRPRADRPFGGLSDDGVRLYYDTSISAFVCFDFSSGQWRNAATGAAV